MKLISPQIFRSTSISRSFVLVSALVVMLVTGGCAQLTTTTAPNAMVDSETGGRADIDADVTQRQSTPKQDDTPSVSPALSAKAEQCEFDDLWVRAQQSFGLDLSSTDPRVGTHFRWYAKHGAYLSRVSMRADRYLHHILAELDKRNMPTEIMLLPIVESAYDPFAYSHGRASGMWQFIPSTGKIYGLKQNWWYDGRRDVVASTAAALDYLQMLSKHYKGDWLLALAAYNSGIGTVNRAIRTNKKLGKKTDFWNLTLPKETRAYVPKLLALAKLVLESDPSKQLFVPIPNVAYFDVVNTTSQIDLVLAAKLSNTDIEEVYRLNPGFNRWATDPDGPHRLLVPADHGPLFEQNLALLAKEQRVTWKRYKVKKNDNLGDLAQRFHTSMGAIQSANQLSGNIIRVGQALLIPVASASLKDYSLSADLRRKKIQSNRSGKSDRTKAYHQVRSGDSFWKIATKHKVGVQQLARWNSMAPNDLLMPGTKLVIWSKKPKGALAKSSRKSSNLTRKIFYPVREGDSIAKIASKFQVKTSDVIRWNSLQRKKYIHAGDRLVLYVDVSRTSI